MIIIMRLGTFSGKLIKAYFSTIQNLINPLFKYCYLYFHLKF